MKFIFIILAIGLGVTSYAGQDGGGGHPCKSDFTKTYRDLKEFVEKTPSVLQKHPVLKEIFTIFEIQSPTIEVKVTPILGCLQAESPIACSIPKKNLLQLYCGPGGWSSLGAAQKTLHLMHEVLWWSKNFDDKNYLYSSKVFQDLGIYLGREDVAKSHIALSPLKPATITIYSAMGNWKIANFNPYLRCITNNLDINLMESSGDVVEDISVFETKTKVSEKHLSATLTVTKPIFLESPKPESSFSKSVCEVGLWMEFLVDGRPPFATTIDIVKIKDNWFYPDVTEEFLNRIGGDYELVPHRGPVNKDGTYSCSLVLNKIRDGATTKIASEHGHFECDPTIAVNKQQPQNKGGIK